MSTTTLSMICPRRPPPDNATDDDESENELGWFAFRSAELEASFLEYQHATWVPRIKFLVAIATIFLGLGSLASLADWDILFSTGRAHTRFDRVQTHGPAVVIIVANAVIRSRRLFGPRHFQAVLSAGLLLLGLVLLVPQIVGLSGAAAATEHLLRATDGYRAREYRDLCRAEHTEQDPTMCQATLAARGAQALAARHFAATGCMGTIIAMLPTGPCAPAAPIALIVLLTLLHHLRFKVSNAWEFGLPEPDLSPMLYLLLLTPTLLVGTTMRLRSERIYFLVGHLSRRRAELRLEQLNVEKERLDYERRFALHKHQRLLESSSPELQRQQPPPQQQKQQRRVAEWRGGGVQPTAWSGSELSSCSELRPASHHTARECDGRPALEDDEEAACPHETVHPAGSEASRSAAGWSASDKAAAEGSMPAPGEKVQQLGEAAAAAAAAATRCQHGARLRGGAGTAGSASTGSSSGSELQPSATIGAAAATQRRPRPQAPAPLASRGRGATAGPASDSSFGSASRESNKTSDTAAELEAAFAVRRGPLPSARWARGRRLDMRLELRRPVARRPRTLVEVSRLGLRSAGDHQQEHPLRGFVMALRGQHPPGPMPGGLVRSCRRCADRHLDEQAF